MSSIEPSLLTRDHGRQHRGVLVATVSSVTVPPMLHSPWPLDGRLFNVTNFGDSSACYVDVTVSDDSLPVRHVFFMTIFNGHLSARYDDLFGAVTDWSRDIEEEIDEALGRCCHL